MKNSPEEYPPIEEKYEDVLRARKAHPEGTSWQDIEALSEREASGTTTEKVSGEVAKVEKEPSILVPVEELIPGIKPQDSIKLLREKSSGNNFGTVYAKQLPRDVVVAFRLRGPRQSMLLQNGFKGQVVVDLGAGNSYGYFAARAGFAKGYIAVDKYRDLSPALKKPDASELDFAGNYIGEDGGVPVACVKEDMLSFLRRLPDDSVSIISSGIDKYVIPNEVYWSEVRKEMKRVLNREGFLVVNDGISLQNDAEVEKIEISAGDLEIYVKKNKERDARIEKIQHEMEAEIDMETDISKLEQRLQKSERSYRDAESSKDVLLDVLRDRIKKRIEELKTK